MLPLIFSHAHFVPQSMPSVQFKTTLHMVYLFNQHHYILYATLSLNFAFLFRPRVRTAGLFKPFPSKKVKINRNKSCS